MMRTRRHECRRSRAQISEGSLARLHGERRGQYLLREWLSPDQIKQYDTYRYFEVVGSDTGTRYLIHRGAAMNVEELTSGGYVARRWCFVPEGAIATGDVMLAQKIGLETFELDVLAVANHDGPPDPLSSASALARIGALAVGLLLTFSWFVALVYVICQSVFKG
jgi:hypothetical protein